MSFLSSARAEAQVTIPFLLHPACAHGKPLQSHKRRASREQGIAGWVGTSILALPLLQMQLPVSKGRASLLQHPAFTPGAALSLPSTATAGNTGVFQGKGSSGKHIPVPPLLALPLLFSGKCLQSSWQKLEVMRKQHLKRKGGKSAEPRLGLGEREESLTGSAGDRVIPTSRAALGRSESVGRARENWPCWGKPRRESPAPWVFCNPLDCFPPSSTGIFASW